MKLQDVLKALLTSLTVAIFAGCGGGGGTGGNPGVQMGGAVQGKALALANVVSTHAGTAGSTDGVGSAARFSTPNDVVSDGTSLYVVDSGNSTIRKIVIATGTTSTLAGKAGVTGSANGTGAAAQFNSPSAITINPGKTTLYVSDAGNNTIRSIDIATGVAATLAGTAGTAGLTNGTGAAALFNAPAGLVSDGTDLYVADTLNNVIRRIVIATGAVTTFAGDGTPGFADGVGTAASFDSPTGVATDGTNLYVTDNGNGAIRQIVIATGVVSTLVDSTISHDFVSPVGIATDGTNLFVADNVLNVVKKVDIATQTVTTLAGDGASGVPGSVDATGGAARFDAPAGVALSGADLYITDADSNIIRKVVVATAAVTTVAGTPSSADGTGAVAAFKNPYDICTDGTSLYVADSGNSTVRKVNIATGLVTTLSGMADIAGMTDGTGASARFNAPGSITTDGTALYVADTGNHTIRKIVIATGAVTTLAGTAGTAGAADGSGTAATFDSPSGITTDGTNLYVSDTGNNSIRKVVIATGAVTTLVSSSAGLNAPYGLTTDGTNLYVADAGSNQIRKVVISTGAISTLTVTGGTFSFPTGITTDGTSLYIADSGNKSVRKVVIATGVVTTVSPDFVDPSGITTDGASLYVADAHADIIARIR